MYLWINVSCFMVVLVDRNTVDIYQVYIGIVGRKVDTVGISAKGSRLSMYLVQVFVN